PPRTLRAVGAPVWAADRDSSYHCSRPWSASNRLDLLASPRAFECRADSIEGVARLSKGRQRIRCRTTIPCDAARDSIAERHGIPVAGADRDSAAGLDRGVGIVEAVEQPPALSEQRRGERLPLQEPEALELGDERCEPFARLCMFSLLEVRIGDEQRGVCAAHPSRPQPQTSPAASACGIDGAA